VSATPPAAATLVRETFGVEPTLDGRLLTIAIPREQWTALGRFARERLECLYFNWLSAIDWKDDGLEVVARVENLATGLSVMMRTRVPTADARCPTLVPVWKGADWMERECFDMFGVTFDGHPDLRRLLLTDEWVGGPPLRKDFVDNGFTPYR
jgi:NADH-quinone oxidoreductase subunit C